MTHRCGSVAIIGRPNVGKSTLLNRFLGQKIAAVSPKPETTRDRLLGILTLPGAQVLFHDTPGIYRGAKTLLAKHQVQVAREALAEANAVLVMTDAVTGLTDKDRDLFRLLPQRRGQSADEKISVFLAMNKVDRARKPQILPQIEEALRLYPFREIFPISALNGENISPLLISLVAALPEGPAAYSADQVTDRPLRVLAQEMIREKALLFTQEEVPHSVAVLVEEWREGTRGAKLYVRATVYVERDSQKGILIGKNGDLLKKVGEASRREIEKLSGRPVFLDLWVKVAKNWRRDTIMLKRLGYA
ncbi:MAG: GTPase Era [Candidatus Omnitrophota bacterium]|nr:GTPase Era [Candidatus Omnitrophota bacterium]